MKKSLLIVSHAMELGGAETSLLGLLDALDPQKWDVDLFLLRHEGVLLDKIPKHINLLPQVPAYTVLARPLKNTLKEGHFLLASARLVAKFAAKRYIKRHNHTESGVRLEYSHKYTCRFMPKIQKGKEYDLAISFLTPHYFVRDKVQAKKKIAWIHSDYSYMQVDVDSELKMWGAYDHIASISDAVTEGFLKTFPSLKDKIILIENILSKSFVFSRADEKIDDMKRDGDEKILLSIGRFCHQKNFDNVPNICSRIVKAGLNIKWYIIGFGADEELIRRKIAEEKMQDYVIVLGKKTNPYPYFRGCDLYVQPSRYEGKAVTVREAQMFGKPVVITRFPTSSSQLEEDIDGCVVPKDNEGCAEGIVELLRDPQRMELLAQNCRKRDYSNSSEVEKLNIKELSV